MKTAGLGQISKRATEVARLNTQSAMFNLWKERARHRRMILWREEMRNKMVHLKQKVEERICIYAWTVRCCE